MFNYDESFSVEKEIAAPAQKVWDIITVPGGLSLFHPFIQKNSSESWNDVGSKDHVTYYSGIEYDREVVQWIEGTAYDLKVYEKGKHKITVSFRIIPIDDQTCKLINTVKVDFIKKLPFPIRWALLKFKIKPLFTSYLCHVHKGLAYYAETGNQVKRNQFGSHPVFSK
jgi:hypothetical protein